jgi:hypothetical protein
VAAAEFEVRGDGDASGGLGDRLPLLPGFLDSGEHLRFADGLGFQGSPDAGEVLMPGRGLRIVGSAVLVFGADGVDVRVAFGLAHEP